MTKEKDLGGSQMTAGKGDRTRDPHPSHKMMMTQRTTNSSTSCPKRCLRPWDDERDSQRNPLPCSERKNTKIYKCGYGC